MQHVFAFNDETKRYDVDGKCYSPDAEKALQHGVLYYKIDGSNGMVQVVPPVDNKQDAPPILKAFQRLDTRGKEPAEYNSNDPLIPLPDGKNPISYPGHSYYYTEVTTNVNGKKALKKNRAMLELVTRHADKLVGLGKEWISVEWVGTMFNKTPGVNQAVALAIHEEQRVGGCCYENDDILAPKHDNGGGKVELEGEEVAAENDSDNARPFPEITIERSYEGMRKFLLEECANHPIEGLILEHEGVYWKIRCDAFLLPKGTKDPFRGNRNNAMVPVFLV